MVVQGSLDKNLSRRILKRIRSAQLKKIMNPSTPDQKKKVIGILSSVYIYIMNI